MADVKPLKVGSTGLATELATGDTIPLVNLKATVTPTADSIPVADGAGQIALGWMPSGVGPATKTVLTSENLAAGDMVNIYDNASTLNARKADADAIGTRCNGFVIASTTSGQNATVYLTPAKITGLSGLTAGTQYFLSATAGGITATPPSGSAQITQSVGVATDTTELAWMPGQPIVRA